jgi:hypothetical protein
MKKNTPTAIDELASRAGSVTELRRIMGDVPWSTIGRWNKALREGRPIPRSAKFAIQAAEDAIAKKEKENHAHP